MDENFSPYIEQIKSEPNIFNKAKLLQFLNVDKQIRINQLARALSVHPSYVCHLLRLLRLPELIIDGYYGKAISMGHLFILSRLKDQESMIKLYEQILAQNLTVLQVEGRVREILYGVKTTGDRLSEETKKKLINRVEKIDPSIKVTMVQTRIRATVEVSIKGSLSKTSEILKKIADSI